MEAHDASTPYSSALAEYLRIGSEEALYRASLLSSAFIEQGLGPEEIVAMHSDEVERMVSSAPARDRARLYSTSLQFLLEVMIAYGIRYKEYTDLKLTETTRQVEQRMELERAKAAEKIRAEEDALRSKEEFLQFIAHELRTPITALQGYIQMMQRRSTNLQPDRLQKSLETMAHSVQGLNRLVRNLLELSRAEAGTSIRQSTVESVDIGEVIRPLVDGLHLATEQKGVTIQLEIPDDVPMIQSNRITIESILSNLLSNAVKYCDQDGHVGVTVALAEGELRCTVADDGAGIAAEDLPHIFEKYYRGANTIRADQGIGLGLAVAWQSAQSLGGRLEVDSTLGVGSTFVLILPLTV